MADLDNATPFAARAMPSSDRYGEDVLLIVIAAQFALPAPRQEPRLELFPIQEPPPLADEFVGEPGQSSIRRPEQSSYTKPATDIHVCGDAFAPHGNPVTRMGVSIRVGPCAVDLVVHGDRTWQRGLTLGILPSAAAPFVRMPLVWERAYGGVAASSTEQKPVFEARNPIGCGLETDPDAAIDKPVPNIEDPRQPLTHLSDRPRPVGVAPIARHWQPRVGYAGTYDEEWRRRRAPLWPDDFDERFFCSAPAYLQASPHLRGGEPVALQGLHPDGPIAFRLPELRFECESRFIGRTVNSRPVLDGVLIETTLGRLSLYYRAPVPAPLSLVRHRKTTIRLVKDAVGL